MRVSSDFLTRGLLICGLAAPVVLTAFVAWGTAATPGYSQLSHTVSQLAAQGRPHPAIMNAGFIATAALMMGFGYGVHCLLGRTRGAKAVGLLAGLHASSLVMVAVFRDDMKESTAAAAAGGMLHTAFALLAFLALALAMVAFAWTVHKAPAWRFLAFLSLGILLLLCALGLSFLFLQSGPLEGLVQRLALMLFMVWAAAVASRGLWLTRPSAVGLPTVRIDAAGGGD